MNNKRPDYEAEIDQMITAFNEERSPSTNGSAEMEELLHLIGAVKALRPEPEPSPDLVKRITRLTAQRANGRVGRQWFTHRLEVVAASIVALFAFGALTYGSLHRTSAPGGDKGGNKGGHVAPIGTISAADLTLTVQRAELTPNSIPRTKESGRYLLIEAEGSWREQGRSPRVYLVDDNGKRYDLERDRYGQVRLLFPEGTRRETLRFLVDGPATRFSLVLEADEKQSLALNPIDITQPGEPNRIPQPIGIPEPFPNLDVASIVQSLSTDPAALPFEAEWGPAGEGGISSRCAQEAGPHTAFTVCLRGSYPDNTLTEIAASWSFTEQSTLNWQTRIEKLIRASLEAAHLPAEPEVMKQVVLAMGEAIDAQKPLGSNPTYDVTVSAMKFAVRAGVGYQGIVQMDLSVTPVLSAAAAKSGGISVTRKGARVFPEPDLAQYLPAAPGSWSPLKGVNEGRLILALPDLRWKDWSSKVGGETASRCGSESSTALCLYTRKPGEIQQVHAIVRQQNGLIKNTGFLPTVAESLYSAGEKEAASQAATWVIKNQRGTNKSQDFETTIGNLSLRLWTDENTTVTLTAQAAQ